METCCRGNSPESAGNQLQELLSIRVIREIRGRTSRFQDPADTALALREVASVPFACPWQLRARVESRPTPLKHPGEYGFRFYAA